VRSRSFRFLNASNIEYTYPTYLPTNYLPTTSTTLSFLPLLSFSHLSSAFPAHLQHRRRLFPIVKSRSVHRRPVLIRSSYIHRQKSQPCTVPSCPVPNKVSLVLLVRLKYAPAALPFPSQSHIHRTLPLLFRSLHPSIHPSIPCHLKTPACE